MTASIETPATLKAARQIFVGGGWVDPSSATPIDVIDSNTETICLQVAAAGAADVDRAVGAARAAFDTGPWPRMNHAERATYLRAMARELRARTDVFADMWPRESGVLSTIAQGASMLAPSILDFYADLATDYPWEEQAASSTGDFSLLVREPVGVVAAIVPWNGPFDLALYKLAPALLAGCTTILKASPEAPTALYVIAEAAEAAQLPAGVVNMITAEREVSEALVRDPRVDKVAFTGSTATGRRIATIMGDRIGRYSLELGGKSAGVILDDADLGEAATAIATAECLLSGQVCASLTRLIVSRHRHDEFAEALTEAFSQKRVGSAFDETSDFGPLVSARQRDRVEGYIAKGVEQGATLLTGGGRPAHLGHGFYVEPTVFAGVDNAATIAQEEIFGPVLSIIPAENEQDAVSIANDSIYGLNASVFTPDVDRARHVAAQLVSGTVGHNGLRMDFGISFGGFKQSGVGREGGREGLLPYLEAKTVILDGAPSSYR